MRIAAFVASLVLIVMPLVDAFETVLQPRRVMHRFRYARLYYRITWRAWRGIALMIGPGKRREAFLSTFGPLSLLGLFATWVLGMIVGFALLHWSLGSPMQPADAAHNLATYLYLSGTTFVTLGYGDLTPTGIFGHAMSVVEAGLGFGFLAVIISYLPVLYQAFSRREVIISLMDARAGSPPSAGQFLLRLARAGRFDRADEYLAEWEQWSAELLESHLSFPVLSYYRSQHDNQSWLAALATILDASALFISQIKLKDSYQAQLTFAMARHSAVDLALVLRAPPRAEDSSRVPAEQRRWLQQALRDAGVEVRDGGEADTRFDELRGMYEPFLNALAARFVLTLPALSAEDGAADNWQRSAWMARTPGIGNLPDPPRDDDHF